MLFILRYTPVHNNALHSTALSCTAVTSLCYPSLYFTGLTSLLFSECDDCNGLSPLSLWGMAEFNLTTLDTVQVS